MPKTSIVSMIATLALFGAIGSADAALVISKKQTSNVDCESGVCNATAANAVLSVKDLANLLATTDVHVFAEGVATDITVASPFSWASSHQLTLGAYGSVNVKAAITAQGTSGLTITTNVAGNGGVFQLVGVGKISFWDTASILVINGSTYTLINNLPALIAAIAANPSGYFGFANDYNAAQDGVYSATPISSFSGSLEGLGNTIRNFSVSYSGDSADYFGLFLSLEQGGQISDLNLAQVSLNVRGGYMAPLVAFNEGAILHTFASGSVSGLSGGFSYGAGLVQDNLGSITRSRSAVNVINIEGAAGGLVLENQGTISHSSASGAVSASLESGGLIGQEDGTTSDSYAQGDVTVTSGNPGIAGGLVGLQNGAIVRCFATGSVEGSASDSVRNTQTHQHKIPHPLPLGLKLGGLAGVLGGTIADSYATGNVIGQGSGDGKRGMVGGGLVGWKRVGSSSIQQSYSLGKINLPEPSLRGGVIGLDRSVPDSNSDTYWDTNTSGISNAADGAGHPANDPGITGLTDAQLKSGLPAGFDPAVWGQSASINDGYPYLLNNPPPQ